MIIFERKLKIASCQFINKFPNQKPGFEVLFAAGLPHFASGWTRSWGRDTFTSNELLLLFPKVYKQVIIQFGSALRHGMIPNLLDGGHNPRYNCRDACWWFIRGVKEYANNQKDYSIFKEKVNMLFLSNDLIEHNNLKKQGKSKIMSIE